jgi:hypothetical protein
MTRKARPPRGALQAGGHGGGQASSIKMKMPLVNKIILIYKFLIKLHILSQHKVRYYLSKCLCLFCAAFIFCLFVITANAYDVILAWDPNDEADIAGYALYVDDGFSEILYEYVDTYPLEEIDPQNPSARITDLSDDLAYYFVVTAYDANGNESDYSDEICVINGDACPESWLEYRRQSFSSTSVSDSSGGGGGGGGACFIATSNLFGNTKKALSSKHIFLFLIFLIVIGAPLVFQVKKSILKEQSFQLKLSGGTSA